MALRRITVQAGALARPMLEVRATRRSTPPHSSCANARIVDGPVTAQ
jgi:hypothetical protein